MSRANEMRRQIGTKCRLALVVVSACSGGLGLAACDTTDGGHEQAPAQPASADTTLLRSEVSGGEENGASAESETANGQPPQANGEATTAEEESLPASGTASVAAGNTVADPSAAEPAADACAAVDWSRAQLRVVAPTSSLDAETLASLSAELLSDTLCVRVTGNGVVDGNYNLLIETDGKLRTGLQSLASWAIAGAEYWVSAGTLMKATTPLTSGGQSVGAVAVTKGSDALVFQLPRALLDVTVAESKIGLGFQLLENWAARASLSLPAGPALIQLDGRWVGDELDTTACPTPSSALGGLDPVLNLQPLRAATPVTRGVIAPLYLPVPPANAQDDDPNKKRWSIVSTAAKAARTSAGTPIDFWVVLNGSNNGPPSTKAEWDNARAAWEQVGDSQSGGRLFGYVHTVKSNTAFGVTTVGPTFRPLAEVENEISSWVQNVKALDGIWLDEFIPRFEIADSAAPTPLAVLSPNDSLRPLDPNVQQYPQYFGGLQVDPTCGYYDRLTRWIHASYPWLRIIGNPGSPLQNNQRSYARLVDVLVGFEHSLLEASSEQWKPLAAGFEPLARKNLALIHGGKPLDAPTATRKQAIDEALRVGFSHVYATDQLYSTGLQILDPNSLGNQNVWGDLPASSLQSSTDAATTSPLEEELNYVASQL